MVNNSYLNIDFYQRYGGKEEIDLLNNSKLKNVILLNTTFDKLIIDNKTNYYFYDSNNAAWKLPKLNNFNVVEAAYIKNRIFGGNFSFINYFPNLEFHNEKVEINNNFSYEIEYFYGNNIQDCIYLYTIKNNGKQKHFYSNNKLPGVQQLTFAEKLTEKEVEGILIVNPTLLTNNILNSYKVIYLLSLLMLYQKFRYNHYI